MLSNFYFVILSGSDLVGKIRARYSTIRFAIVGARLKLQRVPTAAPRRPILAYFGGEEVNLIIAKANRLVRSSRSFSIPRLYFLIPGSSLSFLLSNFYFVILSGGSSLP